MRRSYLETPPEERRGDEARLVHFSNLARKIEEKVGTEKQLKRKKIEAVRLQSKLTKRGYGPIISIPETFND